MKFSQATIKQRGLLEVGTALSISRKQCGWGTQGFQLPAASDGERNFAEDGTGVGDNCCQSCKIHLHGVGEC